MNKMSSQIIEKNRLRDYSSLFSRQCVKSWMKNDYSSIISKVERYDTRLIENNKELTYSEYLKYAYKVLEKHYANEYIYKNTFLNEWLIHELGNDHSQAYNEFKIGNVIADLVIFNGISRVFEIKTELDTPGRLDNQVAMYKRVFNEIYLLVPITKVHIYEKYDNSIGIVTFDKTKKEKFSKYRDAKLNKGIDNSIIMEILHTNEYKDIVKSYFGELDSMTSFTQFEKCSRKIKQIPQNELNSIFIQTIKSRYTENSLSKRCYKELNQLCLALKLKKIERYELIDKLKKPIIMEL